MHLQCKELVWGAGVQGCRGAGVQRWVAWWVGERAYCVECMEPGVGDREQRNRGAEVQMLIRM